MSPTPTNHEAQLAEVLQAGLDCCVEDDTLTVRPIPYRLSGGGIGHGSLICHLNRNGGGHRISERPHCSVDWG